jgi:hypothetical protein
MTKSVNKDFCNECWRIKKDGCSKVECPNRKTVTAQVRDGSERYEALSKRSKHTMGQGSEGSFRNMPTVDDDNEDE